MTTDNTRTGPTRLA